jgi:hypothetical protein
MRPVVRGVAREHGFAPHLIMRSVDNLAIAPKPRAHGNPM